MNDFSIYAFMDFTVGKQKKHTLSVRVKTTTEVIHVEVLGGKKATFYKIKQQNPMLAE